MSASVASHDRILNAETAAEIVVLVGIANDTDVGRFVSLWCRLVADARNNVLDLLLQKVLLAGFGQVTADDVHHLLGHWLRFLACLQCLEKV